MQQTPTKHNKAYKCTFLSYHTWTSWKKSMTPKPINDLKDVCTLLTSTWRVFYLFMYQILPFQPSPLHISSDAQLPPGKHQKPKLCSIAPYCLWQQLVVISLSTTRSLTRSFMSLAGVKLLPPANVGDLEGNPIQSEHQTAKLRTWTPPTCHCDSQEMMWWRSKGEI